MKVKTIAAYTAKGLDKKVNDFMEREEVNVLKIHLSNSVNGYCVLIEYEEK